MRLARWSILASLLLAGGVSVPARADLIVSANGTVIAESSSNSSVSVSTSVGSFNITDVTAAGEASFGGNGELLDVASLDISSVGAGTLTLLITETNLTAADLATFLMEFSGLISNATVETSFYLDTTNSGLLTTLLASTDETTGSFLDTEDLSGLFSITEEIVLTATGSGATLSIDDGVSLIPEPTSLALLGVGLLGCGLIGERRHLRGLCRSPRTMSLVQRFA